MKRVTGNQLYMLCNKYQWFTAGSTKQYGLLFQRSKEGATLEELSYIIWLCSCDEKGNFLDRTDIYNVLVKNSYEA